VYNKHHDRPYDFINLIEQYITNIMGGTMILLNLSQPALFKFIFLFKFIIQQNKIAYCTKTGRVKCLGWIC